MRTLHAHATLAVLIAALGAARGTASAGEFQVEPTRLQLVRQGLATELTITNRSRSPARFEAKVFVWRQDDQGVAQLGPATDLVVYPTLFSIEPGAKRSLRIATTTAPNAVERSYRIFIEELPAKHAPGVAGKPTSVTVLTRIAVPIFVAPTQAVIRGAITGTVRNGGARFTVENHGTVHVKVATVRAIGKDRAGKLLFDRSQPSWYVLADGSRTYTLALAAEECKALDRLTIDAATDRGTWQGTITKPSAGCQGSP